jgi:hypothetical protein
MPPRFNIPTLGFLMFWKVAQFATLGRKGLCILRKCISCEPQY